MNYLLDTCVLSELRKPAPDKNLVEWTEKVDDSHLFISVIVLGEIQKGIARLSDSKKKQSLQIWLEQDLTDRFYGRILPVDAQVALEWGLLLGDFSRKGKSIPVIDGLLAATAICYHCTLVTRNTQDFAFDAIKVLDPWNLK